ncbi:hypothetical protein [Rosistilla oblonga]|uniref:hypothetical protein n=1 Tax=Rosistilla oblonga TaxID=2527990 RepID=UPI003A97E786
MATAAATTDRGDAIISEHIENARRVLWRRELLTAVLIWAVGMLAALIAWAIADQWIFQAGAVLRTLVWLVLAAASIAWFTIRIVPLLRHSIHPEYAAQSLERRVPQLHHSLLSYLTLRTDREIPGLRGVVVRSVASHAARRLADPHSDPLASEKQITLLSGSLLALIAMLAIYAIASPKNTVQSVQRLMMPLASIEAPTSVRIGAVTPGDTQVAEGTSLTITAEIDGLKPDQQAWVETTQGSIAHREVMQATETEFTATVGASGDGIRHDTQYWIVAGDARRGPFEIKVEAVPIVSIGSVQYQPAAYTRLPSRSNNRGAIDGLEGTAVTVVAQSNLPIAKAKIEFNPKRIGSIWQATGGVKAMEIADDQMSMSTSWVLRRAEEERGVVAIESYRIVVEDAQGLTNADPVIYPVKVAADLSPEVSIIVPHQSPKDLPIGMEQLIEVHALDPDFGLSRMEFEIRKGDRVLGTRKIFESTEPLIGQQVSISAFRSEDWNLIAGDKVTVRCRAFDNRDMPGNQTTDPNSTVSEPIELHIVAPPEDAEDEADGDGLQKKSDRESDDPSGSGKQDGEGGGSGGQGDSTGEQAEGKGKGESGGGEAGGDNQEPSEDSESGSDGAGGKPSDKPSEEGTEPNQGGGDAAGDSENKGSSKPGDSPAGDDPSQSKSDPSASEMTQESGPESGGKPGDQAGSPDASASRSESGEEPGKGEATDAETDGSEPPAGNAGDSKSGGSGSQRDAGEDAEKPQDDGPLHDGEIMERIREHMQKQQAEQEQGSQKPSDQESDDSGDGKPEQGADGAEGAGGKEDKQPQPADAKPAGDAASKGEPGERGDQGEGAKPNQGNDAGQMPQDGTKPKPNGGNNNPETGNNGKPDKGDQGSGEGKSPDDKPSATDPANDGKNDANDMAGQEAENQTGSDGKPAGDDQANGKAGDPAGSDAGDGTDAGQQDDAGEDPNSDSKPSQGKGDQKGKGKGEASDPADQTDTPSGDDAGESGDDSMTAESKAGSSDPKSNTQGKPGKRPDGKQGEPGKSADAPPSEAAAQGDQMGDGAGADAALPPEKINQEYAKKATDLVLDYLKKKQSEPDAELLDKLNWTEQDLQNFLNRWQQAQEMGRVGDEKAKQEYLEQIESLGIRPPASGKSRQTIQREDSLRDVRESGQRVAPPALYRDAFEAFRRSISRGDN